MSAELLDLSQRAEVAGDWELSEDLRLQAAEAKLAEFKAQAELGGSDAERIKLGLRAYDFARKHSGHSYEQPNLPGLYRTSIRFAGRPVASIGNRVFEFAEVIFLDHQPENVAEARSFTRRMGPFTVRTSVDALGVYIDPFETDRPFGTIVALRRIKGRDGYPFSTGEEIPAVQHVAVGVAREVFKRAPK
jgi:hypothetical protein